MSTCGGYEYSGYGVAGAVPYGHMVPGTPVPSTPAKPNGEKIKEPKVKPTQKVPANLSIEVPQDAKLYVDGMLTKANSKVRQFVTPPLQNGEAYYYDLKAEVERDGQRIAVKGRVIIRAGQNVRATLSEPSRKGTFLVRAE